MAGSNLRNMSMVVAMAAVIVAAAISINIQCATAQEHHIVGGDRGWATSSDILSWASNKIFRVGDNIWFAYSAAKDSIVELSSEEEFESCNTQNPIKMYTDGIDRVLLENEGTRYFVSSKPEHCHNGLKLNLTVLPPQNTHNNNPYPTLAVAAPEPAASAPEPEAGDDVDNIGFSATAPAPSASVPTTTARLSAIFIGLSLSLSLISSLAL